MPDETNTPAAPVAPKTVDPGTVLPVATPYGGATVSNTLPVMPTPAVKDEPCVNCPPVDAKPELIVLGGEGLSDEFIQMFYSFREGDPGAQAIGASLMAKRNAASAAAKETVQAAALRELGIYVHPAPAQEGK